MGADDKDKIIARFTADITEYKAKLVELEGQLNKLSDTQKDTATEQKKTSAELASASNKRKLALQNEQAELKRLQASLKAAFTVKDIETFNQKIAQTKQNISTLKGETSGIGKVMGGLGGQFAALGAGIAAAFSVQAIIQFGTEASKVAVQFEAIRNTLNFVQGGAIEGGKAFDFLTQLSNRLGLELQSTAKAFKLFSASAQLAGIDSGQTKEIFESVSTAVTALGLSAEDAQGVFLALSQIISKGQVTAEELRGQIGERLPGAFEIAAKAIGVSTKELNKLLEGGKVGAKEFLPLFARELKNTFQGALPTAINSAQSNFNRLKNVVTDTQIKLGTAINKLTNDFLGIFGGLKNREIDPLKELNTQFNIQIETLKRGNLSQENRKTLITEINKEYGQYLPNLLTEKSSLEEIDAAQQAVNKSMLGRILLQQQEVELSKIIKNAADANRELINVEIDRTKAQKTLSDNSAQASAVQAQLNQREQLAKEIIKNTAVEIEKLSAEYGKLSKELGIANDGVKKFETGSKASTDAAKKQLEAAETLQRELLKSGERLIDLLAASEIEALSSTATSVEQIEQGKYEIEKKIIERRIQLRKNLGESTADLERQLADKILDERQKTLSDQQKIAERDIKNANDLADSYAKAWTDANDKISQSDQELFKEREEKARALRGLAVDIAMEISDAIFAIEKQNSDRRFNNELETLAKERDAKTSSKRLTESEKLAIQKDYDQKELALKKKKFEDDKRFAIAQAIINGALAVVKVFATATDYYSAAIQAALIIAETGAEIAVIASQKYAKGTKKAKPGMALVGEEGPEFMYVPGQAKILTAKQTKQHSKVIDAIYDNRLEKLIYHDHVLPALERQKANFNKRKEQSFADSLEKSLIFQGLTEKSMGKIWGKGTSITNTDELAEKIAAIISKGYDRRRQV